MEKVTPLRRADLLADPLEQLSGWLETAEREDMPEPGAMTLATADRTGTPSARVVLFKGIDKGIDGSEVDDGAVLFSTNYTSRKGIELAENDRAALVLLWLGLQRQIRLDGRVERAPAELSDRIFAARPRASRLSAWASRQSQVVPDRAHLERQVRAMEERFPDDVPRPEFWGAYRLWPARVEFWQGQRNRLHDRFVYERRTDGGWTISRLAP